MKTKNRLLLAVFLFLLISSLLNSCATSPYNLADTGLPHRALLAEVPFFPQQAYQCGPAALATMLVYRQVDITPELLVNRIYLPGRKGTLAPEIVAEVRRHNLLPYPLVLGANSLADLLSEVAAGNPVLVMQNLGFSWYPQWHYAVVIGYDLDEQYLILRSGMEAERKTTLRNFENTWRRASHWALVIPARDQLPVTATVPVLLKVAEDLVATGHTGAAHQIYERASLKWPKEPWVWFALGNSFYEQSQPAAAESAYRQGLAIQQNIPELWNNLAYALLAQGCHSQALEAAHCAVARAPEDKNSRLTLQEIESHHPAGIKSTHCDKVSC